MKITSMFLFVVCGITYAYEDFNGAYALKRNEDFKNPLILMPSEDVLKMQLKNGGCEEFITSTSLVTSLGGKSLYGENVVKIVAFSMNQYAVNSTNKHHKLAALWKDLKDAKKTILEIVLQDHPEVLVKVLRKISL